MKVTSHRVKREIMMNTKQAYKLIISATIIALSYLAHRVQNQQRLFYGCELKTRWGWKLRVFFSEKTEYSSSAYTEYTPIRGKSLQRQFAYEFIVSRWRAQRFAYSLVSFWG